jgi:hypothetical protein
VPAAVRADLDEAERLLGAGKADDALRAAERTLRVHKTAAAFELRARAYCSKGDLGGALAELRNVGAKQRAEVRRQCRTQYHFDLP